VCWIIVNDRQIKLVFHSTRANDLYSALYDTPNLTIHITIHITYAEVVKSHVAITIDVWQVFTGARVILYMRNISETNQKCFISQRLTFEDPLYYNMSMVWRRYYRMVRRSLEDGRSKKNISFLLAKVAKSSKLWTKSSSRNNFYKQLEKSSYPSLHFHRKIYYVDLNDNFTRHRLYIHSRSWFSCRRLIARCKSLRALVRDTTMKRLPLEPTAVLKNRKEIYEIWTYVYKLPPLPDRSSAIKNDAADTYLYNTLYARGRCSPTHTYAWKDCGRCRR